MTPERSARPEAVAAIDGRNAMTTTLGRLSRLTRLRRIAIPLIAIESIAVLIEKTTQRDPLPDWVDVTIACLGIGALFLVSCAEALTGALSRGIVADAHDLAARRGHDEDNRQAAKTRRERIENILEGAAYPSMVFQPIVELQTGKTVGYEALSRFGTGTPDAWFADATRAGLGAELELKAIRRGLEQLGTLPADTFLTLNCSPATLLTDALYELVARYPGRRIVIELTEQTPIDDYPRCRAAGDRLRSLGARLAIDDLGAGYASLQNVITLQPEIIKLDRDLAQVADQSVQTMVQTLVTLSRLTGATLIAEGIEDTTTLTAVRDLGVQLGQGFHLGRPKPIADVVEELIQTAHRA
jgi:EAL domain-containing protein (putative c-di-GMP-specific phosphodiesterase class I)